MRITIRTHFVTLVNRMIENMDPFNTRLNTFPRVITYARSSHYRYNDYTLLLERER